MGAAQQPSFLAMSRDTMRTIKNIGMSLAAASLGLTGVANGAFAGKMDALLGDWDLNIVKSRFEPSPPMKKVHHEGD